MALIPPLEERRKAGNGPSPYFSSVLGLFGGIVFWLSASALLYGRFLPPFLPETPPEGGWTTEQIDAAMSRLAAQTYGPFVILAPQLAFVLVACVLGFLSRVSFVDRLALARPRHSPLTLALLACGMLGVQGLVLSLSPYLGESSDQVKLLSEVIREPEGSAALTVALLVSLVPAFCEELFFRGLVQSRLVAIWPPGLAILVCSSVFALTHIDAQHAIAVLPIGLYLGWAAWKSGSVWTSMLLHALNNLAVVLLVRTSGEELPAWQLALATALLLALGFAGARRISRSDACAETVRRSREGLQ